jgi:hypothetical protein
MRINVGNIVFPQFEILNNTHLGPRRENEITKKAPLQKVAIETSVSLDMPCFYTDFQIGFYGSRR